MGLGFRDLNIWKKGLDLVVLVYKITEKFPKEEKFGLSDQLKRASNSVIANIAEAQGRYHFADRCRVLPLARGECFEVRSHLSVALSLGYITGDEFSKIDLEYEGLAVGINSYVYSLKNA